jgi:alpha/beta hydrolase family protein
VRIRTDLDVPVFMFETQTDLAVLGYAPAQQPNTARIRTWEVAGTSPADG